MIEVMTQTPPIGFDKMNQKELLAKLHWRYAVKKFDPTRKISSEDWLVLAESLRLSPSSFGLQPWKFVVVQSPELRKQLMEVSWRQKQVEDCSHYVVFLTLNQMTEEHVSRFVTLTAATQEVDETKLEGFRKMLMTNTVTPAKPFDHLSWTQKQSYIAMGFLMETAALLGVDTCPMEGLDPLAYDRILEIENSPWRTVATVALGYRSPEDRFQNSKKVRFTANEVIEYR